MTKLSLLVFFLNLSNISPLGVVRAGGAATTVVGDAMGGIFVLPSHLPHVWYTWLAVCVMLWVSLCGGSVGGSRGGSKRGARTLCPSFGFVCRTPLCRSSLPRRCLCFLPLPRKRKSFLPNFLTFLANYFFSLPSMTPLIRMVLPYYSHFISTSMQVAAMEVPIAMPSQVTSIVSSGVS